MKALVLVCATVLLGATVATVATAADRPNVLFISLDDLNDWVGCLGGHPQAKTPNLDKLAGSGVLFDNAHCAAPACNPSRTAIMTGLSPHRSGVYANEQKMREVLPDAELLPKYFSRHGYWSGGSGKILHYFIDAQSWDAYYPDKETEDPFPPHIDWGDRPKSLPRGGPWQYVETDWHAFDVSDDAFGGDAKVADWVSGKLKRKHDKPFFLACGIYRPHEPWFVPKKYFDLFPLEEVQLPPGYKEDDLDDLPSSGKRAGPNRYFAHIRVQGQWQQAVQAYLASIAYADAMLGRVLDALESSPHKDNTIVVMWSDHGWHLGEKQHWQKFTNWRAATRVPFIIRVPPDTPGLPEGTAAGGICSRPVNLLSLFPTLTELCGLPEKPDNDGPSLVPLLNNPKAPWPHISLTYAAHPGSFGLSAEGWRYLRYRDGGEELYDITADPYEWTNLAEQPAHSGKLEELRRLAPKEFAPLIAPNVESLPLLKWHTEPGHASSPDGNPFDVVFVNRRAVPVELFWMDRKGIPKSYGQIGAGKTKRQQTRPGAVWQIALPESTTPLGHFVVDDRSARAEIPAAKPQHRVTVPPKELKLDPFYRKYVNVGGYPVVSSEKVSDYALLEAAYLIETMLDKRPDILVALGDTGSRMTVMAYNEFTTDVPEHARLGSGDGDRSSDWWDRRARGLGGSATDPVASCGEENLLCFPGDPYHKENLLIHEFAHTIHLRGVNHLDPSFDDRLKEAYDKAMKAGLWKTKYAGTNHHEYFAEGVQSWFNNNRENDHDHNHVNTREELIEYDAALASIVEEVFRDTEFEYVRPPDRPVRGHLEGYEFSGAPEFKWPDRLQDIDPKQ